MNFPRPLESRLTALFRKGGDKHYKTDHGGSLLHAAAMNGNVPVIKHAGRTSEEKAGTYLLCSEEETQ